MKIKTILLIFLLHYLNFSLFSNSLENEYNNGIQAFKEKKLDEAKQHFLHCLKEPNYRVNSFLALGQVALAQKDTKSAQNFFKYAIYDNGYFSNGHSNSKLHLHVSNIYKNYGYTKKMTYHEKRALLLDESKTTTISSV